jgi:hypothetical protein
VITDTFGFVTNALKGSKMPKIKQIDRIKNARNAFVATPEHHNMKIDDLMVIYNVGRSKISDFRRLVGIKTQFEIKVERDALIRAHPLYGDPGFAAPCAACEIANDVGCCTTTVSDLRRVDGIENCIKQRNSTSFQSNYQRMLSREEKDNYALCRLTRTWGRPEGMGA